MAVALGEAREQLLVELAAAPPGRPGRRGPSRRSAGAARGPSDRRGVRGSRRSARCRRRRTRRPRPARAGRSSSSSARCARSPTTSTELPPRKCRIRTPRSKPSRLTRMKSSSRPWNQVAIITPVVVPDVRKRSQSPASRHSAQFSTRSRISSRSVVKGQRLLRPVACRRCGSSRPCGRARPGPSRARPPSRRSSGYSGSIDEVAAGRDLDAVAARLDSVEEEALRDGVLGRRRLDVDLVVEEQVGGAQALLARVDPECEVVQAPVGAVGVARVDQLVRGDRRRTSRRPPRCRRRARCARRGGSRARRPRTRGSRGRRPPAR